MSQLSGKAFLPKKQIAPALGYVQSPFAFIGVHLVHQPPLLEVVCTTGSPRRFTRTRQGRQENGGQNPDDGYNDEEVRLE